MMPNRNNGAFSHFADISEQPPIDDIGDSAPSTIDSWTPPLEQQSLEDATLHALAQQTMAENLTPQETEAIYALLQDGSAKQLMQAPMPPQTEEANLQVLAQQAMAENLTPQETEAIYAQLQGAPAQEIVQAPPSQQTDTARSQALTLPVISALQAEEATHALLQGGPTKETAQAQCHQPIGGMNSLLQQVEEAAAQQKISTKAQLWLTKQIHRWLSQEQTQQWLEANFERMKNSPIFMRNRFTREIDRMKTTKYHVYSISNYFENIQRSLSDGTIKSHLDHNAAEADKQISFLESRQEYFVSTLLEMRNITKDDETKRCKDLKMTMELSEKNIGELQTSIRDTELELEFAAEFNQQDLVDLQARQVDLQKQCKREQIAFSRLQGELRRLQTPWPELQPGISTRPEPRPGLETRREAQPGASRER